MGVALQLSILVVFLGCLFGLNSVSSAPLGDDNNKLLGNSAAHAASISDVHADRLKRARDFGGLSSFYKRSDLQEVNADSQRTGQEDAPMYVMVPLPRRSQRVPVSEKELEAINDVSKRFYKRFYKRGRLGNNRFYLGFRDSYGSIDLGTGRAWVRHGWTWEGHCWKWEKWESDKDGGNEPFYLANNKRGYESSFY